MNLFTPADSTLFYSRKDPADRRLGDLVRTSPEDAGVAILGYPDDEGVKLNGGRTGAAEGPDAIRHWLYRLTPHPQQPMAPLFDFGNLKFASDLSHRHKDVAACVEDLLRKGHRVLGLGGGNDYAFADGLGFLNTARDTKEKPVIINIDAHLDVRGLEHGLTSGTPFYRLLEADQEFDFIEFGAQSSCNAQAHWDYVIGKGGKILSMDEILLSGLSLVEFFTERTGDLLLKKRPAYVSIDMDAFAYPYANGSSAPWPLGLLPHDFFSVLHLMLRRWDVRVMGIYEVAPSLGEGHATAKLAAQWAHMFLHV